MLYVFSNTLTRVLAHGQAGSGAVGHGLCVGGGGQLASGLTVQGLPLVSPPWGRITAFDLNKGEMVWQVAHGETLDTVRNHPALKGVTIPRTGQLGPLGTLTTRTLVISGESAFTTTPKGRGAMLRAYDKATGKNVAEVFMPGAADRHADDVHAQRQTIPRGRCWRRRCARGAHRVHVAVLGGCAAANGT